MDFVQTIKAEHARIMETIDKLAETSDGAVKSRERLVAQLRAVLEPHAQKEEAHLYPALASREEARDFLAGARQAHDEMTRLVTALDESPKNEEGFLERVTELRRVIAAHVREEERQLGGLKRALDDDGQRQLDDAMAGRGEAALGDGMRSFARQAMAHNGEASRTVLAAAEIYGETAQFTADDLHAIATCTSIAAGGMNEFRAAWMDWLNRNLRAGARVSQQIMRCGTLQELAEVQRDFLEESIGSLLQGGAQLLRISGRIAEEARRPIEARIARPERRIEVRERA